MTSSPSLCPVDSLSALIEISLGIEQALATDFNEVDSRRDDSCNEVICVADVSRSRYRVLAPTSAIFIKGKDGFMDEI